MNNDWLAAYKGVASKELGSGWYVIPVIPYFFGNFQSVGPFRKNTPYNTLT